jgi:2-hydroxychromene-2-carboxylate isomerase
VGAAAVRRAAEERAGALRMPLIWPESFPGAVPAAMRVAAAAAHSGRGAAFVLAASRLAFCGGYDLEDPETLAEAAAAAGIQLEDCLSAAGAAEHDRAIQAAGRELLADGVQELPALRIGPGLYAGDTGVDDALTAARVARVIQA